jgi:DnaJ-domain-containing protein 1
MINTDLKGHFLNLYMIALSDNNFDEKELETILKIGEEKGISKEEFEKIIINPTSVNIQIPTDFISKINLLYDFARVIWSDGKIEEDEKISFMKYCEKFGFDIEESEELFEWLIGFAKNNLTVQELEKEIIKISNN